MKYLLPIIASLMLFTTIPAKAGHVPLEIGKSYTDRVTVCKKENLMKFIREISRVTDTNNEQEILNSNGCSTEQQTFVAEGYVCSFVVNNVKTYSIVKTDDRIHKYISVYINPSENLIECTGERIEHFPIRIPTIE